MGFRVSGLGFRVSGLGFRGLGFRVSGLGFFSSEIWPGTLSLRKAPIEEHPALEAEMTLGRKKRGRARGHAIPWRPNEAKTPSFLVGNEGINTL